MARSMLVVRVHLAEFMCTGERRVDRFHEISDRTDRIQTREPHPEERALARVSKDGSKRGPFEKSVAYQPP